MKTLLAKVVKINFFGKKCSYSLSRFWLNGWFVNIFIHGLAGVAFCPENFGCTLKILWQNGFKNFDRFGHLFCHTDNSKR